MTLGRILASKDWDRSVRVELLEPRETVSMKTREIFMAAPGIFFSHSWKDRSIQVGPFIRDQIEMRMRELVWYDEQMMSTEDQFQARMNEGISNAWAVFVFLSLEALSSGNCLREICQARERQLDPTANTRIIVFAMEKEVTYAEIAAWPVKSFTFFSAKDRVPRTVHARTVKWVKEHLLGVNIYQEWVEGRPDDPEKQSQALDRIISNLRKPLDRPADSKPPPEFEIENQGEVWILGTKGDAELPAEALVPPHSAGTTAVAPAKAAPPAATTAATAADETPQSSVGTTAGTSSELPAAAPVEPSATTEVDATDKLGIEVETAPQDPAGATADPLQTPVDKGETQLPREVKAFLEERNLQLSQRDEANP
ncbi:hypothetical protein T484DRAFT_1787478 [Baffinella frigidus]|nr:hypothetical protein T484DRAFT_1787478 [Cryptophyta sp. CCMP2293]